MLVTVEMFKTHFTRDFPYLPYWVEGKAYFKDEVVYDGLNFYQSQKDGNLSQLSNTTDWKLYNDSVENYLSDADIEKAINEANLGFNAELFSENCQEAALVLMYLIAFYLVIDIKNSTSGLSSNAYTSFVSSKSVGNVHESYGIPAWVQSNPMWAIYLDNGYGKKYLSYIIPRITGWFYLSEGATTWAV